MSQLDFNAETHTYRLAGRVVPSVTEVINAVIPGWQAGVWYMQRGSATHHGCRLLDEGTLDWATVAEEITPRIKAWQAFRKDWHASVVHSEHCMVSERYQFAGTADRIFLTEWTAPAYKEWAIADIKSTIAPQVRIQLAAYSLLCAETHGVRPRKAVAIELREDATYKTLWLDARELRLAEQQFLAALTVYGFMKTHGIIAKG